MVVLCIVSLLVTLQPQTPSTSAFNIDDGVMEWADWWAQFKLQAYTLFIKIKEKLAKEQGSQFWQIKVSTHTLMASLNNIWMNDQ